MSKVTYSKDLKLGRFEVHDSKPSQDMIHVHQVHSPDIVNFEGISISSTKADGIICNLSDMEDKMLAIKTADCLPILYLSDDKVALVHAGWKGLQTNIHLDKALIELDPHTILIGPSIQCSQFEITNEFLANFAGSPHFSENSNKHITFNLQAYAVDGIRNEFPNANLIDDQICTVLDTAFHSYRRDKTTKRNWNIYTIS